MSVKNPNLSGINFNTFCIKTGTGLRFDKNLSHFRLNVAFGKI